MRKPMRRTTTRTLSSRWLKLLLFLLRILELHAPIMATIRILALVSLCFVIQANIALIFLSCSVASVRLPRNGLLIPLRRAPYCENLVFMQDAAALCIDMLFLVLAGHLLIHVLEQRRRHHRLLLFSGETGLTSPDIACVRLLSFQNVSLGMTPADLLRLELGHVLCSSLRVRSRLDLLIKDVCSIIDFESEYLVELG